jgi:hypothetical protein
MQYFYSLLNLFYFYPKLEKVNNLYFGDTLRCSSCSKLYGFTKPITENNKTVLFNLKSTKIQLFFNKYYFKLVGSGPKPFDLNNFLEKLYLQNSRPLIYKKYIFKYFNLESTDGFICFFNVQGNVLPDQIIFFFY